MEVSKKELDGMEVVRKELRDMTLEELWALFPIELVPHRAEWVEWAKEEIVLLSGLLSAFSPIISHIGSTAIPNIWAKPIVDILVEVPMSVDINVIMDEMGSERIDGMRDGDRNKIEVVGGYPTVMENRAEMWQRLKALMEDNGYIRMSESAGRMSFNKGYTPEGYAERVFHIHFHNVGDNDEVYFRDYLIAHPEIAKDYEALKLSLLPEYRNNRDGYTEAKSDFVRRITAMAKSEISIVQ
ncbi:MAG: GrpB family protein [Muribaculaceae bacterium]|nr:GrpB family protein [Muribaculaceae bacterium]